MTLIRVIMLFTGFYLVFFHPPIEALPNTDYCVVHTCHDVKGSVKRCPDDCDNPPLHCTREGWSCRRCTDAEATGFCPEDIFTGKCLVGNKKDGFSQQKCPEGQICQSVGCKYNGGTRYIKNCTEYFCSDKKSENTCKKFLGETKLVESTCESCGDKDLCNNHMDTGEDPLKAKFTLKCWVGNMIEGFSEQMCPPGQLCGSVECHYNGGSRYIKSCAGINMDLCENDERICDKFLGETRVDSSSCRRCGTDLCNAEMDWGNDPPKYGIGSAKFTGKCWKGSKEEGYSEHICLAGQPCYSVGCEYDGGIRFVKGCAAIDPCAGPNTECFPWMALGETFTVRHTCKTCQARDLCNDEKDVGDLPAVVTGMDGYYGTKSGASGGLKCNLIASPAFPFKQKTHTCHPKHTHCMIMDYCGIMTVGSCWDDGTCGNSAYAEVKAQRERSLNKTINCRTCDTNFCNGPDGNDNDGATAGPEGSNSNASEGMRNAMISLVVVMAVVASLINLYLFVSTDQ